MEVTTKNTFECDALTMDALLGYNSVGEQRLRLDPAQHSSSPRLEARQNKSNHSNQYDFSQYDSSSPAESKRAAEVYAPLEVVPANSAKFRIDSATKLVGLHCDEELKRDRLLRLLAQQQSWYDAQQKAALAAEQLLALCEHHQQQWLQPNQQTSVAPLIETR